MKFRTLAITYVLEKVPPKKLPSRENCPIEISSTRIVAYPPSLVQIDFSGAAISRRPTKITFHSSFVNK